MTMREQWIAAYKQKYASCCRQGEREKASGKGRDSGRKRRGKSQIESESQSRGGFDLITALEHAVCQSKFLHDFSFLQCLLRNMSRLKASRDVVQIRSFFRLVGALPLAEQWATFVLIHEESLELDLDDLLLSSFLGHVKATVQNMFPGRGLEDGFRAIDLLRITQEEMREGDIVDNMNLVLLFVDILLSYEPSQEEQERVISLIQIAASSHTFDFSWRRIFIEVLLNAKALEVSSSVDGGEICELLLSHQNMVGVPGGKSKDELLSEVAGPGCFMRIDTLIFCLQALESGAEEFQSARKHVLSILLIKLKMLFGREVKDTAGGDVDGNHKEAEEEEKEKEFRFRCFYRLEEFNTRMQYVLKEVVNTFFSYCNMNAMIGHSKVVRQHYHYFDVVCGRKSAKAQKIDWSLVLESDSILLKDNHVEDKVVVLCLLQETVKYFTRCGHSIEELVGVMKWAMKRESLVKLFKVATGHGTTPTSRGKSEWMESKRVLEDKPYSCLANAFTVLLHFQLITQPNEIVITAALAVLKELQPFVSMENVDDKGDHKSSNRSVHDLVVRELLLASLLADANLPMKLSSVLSCMFAYLKQDAQTVNRKLCSLFSESAEAEAEAEAESKEQYRTFFHLMDTFYKPYFSLKSKSYASTKASQGPEGDHFFQILFTMIELLLEIVDFPAKEILWNSESVTLKKGMDKSKIKAVLEMSQSCLEILQIIFVEYGLDLEACNDKLKCRVERSSMMFDYILSKLLHAMKLYESSKEEEEEEEEGGGEGEGVGFVSQRSADQQARGSDCLDMYHSVKNFVTKSIETFSIEKAQKKEQEKAGKRSESASQVEDTRQEQNPSTAVRARDTSDDHREKREALTQKRTRRKTSKRSRNAYINAALQGEGYYKDFDGDELDDLEDFIVCKPGRNYDQVLAKRAPPSSRKTKKVSKAVPAKVQSLEMNH